MTESFDTSGGNIVVIQDGAERFNTAKRQFRRVPQATITLGSDESPYDITFPSFSLTAGAHYNYHYATFHSSFPDATGEQCVTEGKIPAQEWGPSAAPYGYASPFVLDDIDLGAVPGGCDYPDVRVNLTRTTAPSLPGASHPIYNNYDWPIEIQEGEWLPLTDGALVIERIVGMSRLLWFEVVAGRLLLRRRQSIASAGFATHLIDERQNVPTTGSLTSSHAGGSGCSITNNFNSQSIYSGQVTIVPCISV